MEKGFKRASVFGQMLQAFHKFDSKETGQTRSATCLRLPALSGFDQLISPVKCCRGLKEEIKEMASLVFIQGVVFLTQFIILLLEKTGEETQQIQSENVFSAPRSSLPKKRMRPVPYVLGHSIGNLFFILCLFVCFDKIKVIQKYMYKR